VVSLYGYSFASRVAASLMHDLGMPELACKSIEEYFRTSLEMTKNEMLRFRYKHHLEDFMKSYKWPYSVKKQATSLANVFMQIEEMK